MSKSIYRKAAEIIAEGKYFLNGHLLGNHGRIYSCIVIDAINYYKSYHESEKYYSFMLGDEYGVVFDTNDEAVLALLLFDEILKHNDYE